MDMRVVLGMSGGLDSSVAAYLLQKDGYEVIGATFTIKQASVRCTRQNEIDARQIATMLRIAHFSLDVSSLFENKVITCFTEEYRKGRTPNPCAVCNPEVKFRILLEKARQLNARSIATGHYARIVQRESTFSLARGVDRDKDQSYFLARLPVNMLKTIIFPLGTFRKQEALAIAKAADIPLCDREESQEICFVPDNDYRSFLIARMPELQNPGDILTMQGDKIGTHNGIFLYTVGQRRGIQVNSKKALYVIAINAAKNSIVVGGESDAFRNHFRAHTLNWLVREEQIPETCLVKIRSQHEPAPARLKMDNKEAIVEFEKPQMAVTPGQLAVFYDNDIVVGSGWIE
jgi:tRNA-specific 2-thiouridylase